MTLATVVFLIMALIGLTAVAVLWAGGIEAEPPPTDAEKRAWFSGLDVVEDDGEYR